VKRNISLLAVITIGILGFGFSNSSYLQNNAREEAVDTYSNATSSFHAYIIAIDKLPSIDGSNYKKDDKYVYWGNDVIPNSDPGTFSIIDRNFAKDRNQVYSEGRVLIGADPETFVASTTPYDSNSIFIKTSCGDFVLCYKKIEGADSNTYQILTRNFGRDNFHVFYETQIIPEADISTFAVLQGDGYFYGADRNNFYTIGYDRIGVISRKCGDLGLIGGYYFRCDNNIYHIDTLLEDADSGTFIPVGVTSNYAKDSKNVYFDGKIVIGADPTTFSIGDGINTHDSRYTYRFGKRIE
jgi:hypothetical protein